MICRISLKFQNSCRKTFLCIPYFATFLSRKISLFSLYSKILAENIIPIFNIFQNSGKPTFSLYCIYLKFIVEKMFPIFLLFQNSCRQDFDYIRYIEKFSSRNFFIFLITQNSCRDEFPCLSIFQNS